MPSVFVFSNLILLPRAHYHSMSFYEVQKVYAFPFPSLAITAKINSEQQCFLQIRLNEALFKTDKVPEKSHSLYVEKEKTGEYMYMWNVAPLNLFHLKIVWFLFHHYMTIIEKLTVSSVLSSIFLWVFITRFLEHEHSINISLKMNRMHQAKHFFKHSEVLVL